MKPKDHDCQFVKNSVAVITVPQERDKFEVTDLEPVLN